MSTPGIEKPTAHRPVLLAEAVAALAIEAACGLLPYPWGDRVEATLGNFGLWVQITLAIIALRILVWLVMSGLGLAWRLRREV